MNKPDLEQLERDCAEFSRHVDKTVAVFGIAEPARHCVNAAIRHLDQGNEDEAALGILQVLKVYLDKAANVRSDAYD